MRYKFFGKDCSRANLEGKLRDLGWEFDSINFVHQVHLSDVAVAGFNLDEVKADAIVSNIKGAVIGVVTADCAPIILSGKKAVAVVHAGWRGALAEVIENTVAKMRDFGCVEIEAFLGPMIRQDSYEVSSDFYQEFLQKNEENSQFFRKISQKNKFLFDLAGFVSAKLRDLGVLRVDDCGVDTYIDEGFSSYRLACHQGSGRAGRNISVVML